MRAAWYERQGSAEEVLQVGEQPEPQPGPGEVRVRLTYSGINPGDVKKRQGREGSLMFAPLVIPHSDGAGVIDAVGAGVDPARVGCRVWVYGAQSYRPFGTAAEATVVPDRQAVDLPDQVSDELGATLGITGITAHRAVFGDGPVDGTVVLVHGVLGGVGLVAARLAARAGATVLGTVRRTSDLDRVEAGAVPYTIALDQPDAVDRITALAPNGVHRIVEVALAANADLDAAVAAQGATVAAYATDQERTAIPFWPLLFQNVTIRLLGSDDFPAEAKEQAAADLTALAASGLLNVPIAEPYPLKDVAPAHDAVAAGARAGRVLLSLS
jgi:NADPH:quinone reductase